MKVSAIGLFCSVLCACSAAGAPERQLSSGVAAAGRAGSSPSAPVAGAGGGLSRADAMPPLVVPVSAAGSGATDDCSSAAKLVYVLDQSGELASFRPDTLQFVDIGQLTCESGSRPYSMSVDRDGTAWVVYESGTMYKVSTADARCMPITRPAGAAGFTTFGMSFVAVGGQVANDRLFIAGSGGLNAMFMLETALGVIEPSTLSTTRVGALVGVNPELTGTADGKLWGFYPQSEPPTLDRLDPATAATLETHPLTMITSGSPLAWAVAFWGGDFWIFLRLPAAASTVVYRVDGTTFTQAVAIPDTGRSIVGAGVSTCAPLELL